MGIQLSAKALGLVTSVEGEGGRGGEKIGGGEKEEERGGSRRSRRRRGRSRRKRKRKSRKRREGGHLGYTDSLSHWAEPIRVFSQISPTVHTGHGDVLVCGRVTLPHRNRLPLIHSSLLTPTVSSNLLPRGFVAAVAASLTSHVQKLPP